MESNVVTQAPFTENSSHRRGILNYPFKENKFTPWALEPHPLSEPKNEYMLLSTGLNCVIWIQYRTN